EEIKGFNNQMRKVFSDIRVGMEAIKSEPKILFLICIYVLFNFASTSFYGIYNVVLQGEMALSATWMGAISASMAVIAVIASLIVMKIGKMKRKLILVFIFFSMQAIGLFLFAFNRNPWIMILINIIPFGIVNGISNIPSNTLRQEKISHNKLGRVMSSVLLFISIANLLGNGIVTAVSNYVKPMYIVLSGAILVTLLTIGSIIVFLSKRSLRCSDYSETEVVEEEQVEKIVPSDIDQIPSSRIDEFDILTKDTDKRLPFDGSVPSPSLD
ncbi:MAG: MFS transporter, partial [Candidatus Heimdallarchaeota archaeon]